MRWAKSLLYGGALIDAWKADYKDYARLLLRCRYCGEAVHLVGGCHRDDYARLAPKSKNIVVVKGYDVRPAFAHFPDIESKCPSKADGFTENKVTEAEIRKSIVAGRNQRLKTFQKRFWSIIVHESDCNKYVNRNFIQALCKANNCEVSEDFKALNEQMILGFTDGVRENKDYLKEYAMDTIEKVVSNPEESIMKMADSESRSKTLEWLSVLEKDLHHTIVCEALDYLCIKSSHHVLCQFFDLCFGLVWFTDENNGKGNEFVNSFKITKDFHVFNAKFKEAMSKSIYAAPLFLIGLDWSAALCEQKKSFKLSSDNLPTNATMIV
jgi:hypothetical protein